MASTKTNSASTTKENSSSNSQSAQASTGGSSSATSSQTQSNYGSTTNTHSNTNGGSHSETNGKSWYSGTVDDNTNQHRNDAVQDYQTSDQVNETYQRLQDTLNNKPTFNSTYKSKLDSLYDNIMNSKDFSYNFNTDEMYQLMKDEYSKNGKSAMADTMGQASALTGGYSNSYAQTAGQQQYQNYLSQLNSTVIPELRDQAYTEYQNDQEQLLNKYNITNSAYNNEYGEYRDSASDWQNDRSYNQSAYQDERNYDYDKYQNDRNFWNDEYWKEKQSETSNTSSTDEKNWSTTDATSNTNGWENSVSNSNTNSTNWDKTLSNTNSNTNSTSNTNSSSSSVSGGSGGSRSGSRSSSGSSSNSNNGFHYKVDSDGNIKSNLSGYKNGETSAQNLSSNTKTQSSRHALLGYLGADDGASVEDKLDALVNNGDKASYVWNGKEWVTDSDYAGFNDTDAAFLLNYLEGNYQTNK